MTIWKGWLIVMNPQKCQQPVSTTGLSDVSVLLWKYQKFCIKNGRETQKPETCKLKKRKYIQQVSTRFHQFLAQRQWQVTHDIYNNVPCAWSWCWAGWFKISSQVGYCDCRDLMPKLFTIRANRSWCSVSLLSEGKWTVAEINNVRKQMHKTLLANSGGLV